MIGMDGGVEGRAAAVKVVGGIDEGYHQGRLVVGDRLWFRSAAGKMPAGLGQTQSVALYQPSQCQVCWVII